MTIKLTYKKDCSFSDQNGQRVKMIDLHGVFVDEAFGDSKEEGQPCYIKRFMGLDYNDYIVGECYDLLTSVKIEKGVPSLVVTGLVPSALPISTGKER